MKQIELKSIGQVSARDIIALVVGSPGNTGIALEEMRRRCRILDALEATGEEPVLRLEDADFQVLSGLLRLHPFGVASTDLLSLLDGILQAPNVGGRPVAAAVA